MLEDNEITLKIFYKFIMYRFPMSKCLVHQWTLLFFIFVLVFPFLMHLLHFNISVILLYKHEQVETEAASLTAHRCLLLSVKDQALAPGLGLPRNQL